MREEKRRYFSGKTVIFAIILSALVLTVVLTMPVHTTPEYPVDSYDELEEKMGDRCILPDRELVPKQGVSYMIHLKSRFTNRPSGYHISYHPTDGSATEIHISCQSTKKLPAELLQIGAGETWNGVGIAVTDNHVSFILDGYRYDIHGMHPSNTFEAMALSMAKQIMSRRNPE